jgi:hypothetical protein
LRRLGERQTGRQTENERQSKGASGNAHEFSPGLLTPDGAGVHVICSAEAVWRMNEAWSSVRRASSKTAAAMRTCNSAMRNPERRRD